MKKMLTIIRDIIYFALILFAINIIANLILGTDINIFEKMFYFIGDFVKSVL